MCRGVACLVEAEADAKAFVAVEERAEGGGELVAGKPGDAADERLELRGVEHQVEGIVRLLRVAFYGTQLKGTQGRDVEVEHAFFGSQGDVALQSHEFELHGEGAVGAYGYGAAVETILLVILGHLLLDHGGGSYASRFLEEIVGGEAHGRSVGDPFAGKVGNGDVARREYSLQQIADGVGAAVALASPELPPFWFLPPIRPPNMLPRSSMLCALAKFTMPAISSRAISVLFNPFITLFWFIWNNFLLCICSIWDNYP